MLPGADSTAGKAAYATGAVLVSALCIWRITRTVATPGLRRVPYPVVCDACGELELDREVPVKSDGSLDVPVACGKCGAKAAYLSYYCPSCGEPIPVDPSRPPEQCKHCKADLKGAFGRPSPPR